MSWPRFAAITFLIPWAALLLFAIVAEQADSDLPQHIPTAAWERACSIVAAVILWPVVAAAKLLGPGGHDILWGSSFLFSGLFWALLVEFLFITKNARKA
jgi:hypothetical protein